ncbi:MAG: oligosaccharide flippase family protein [Kaistella sp.]|nr:oligosaccharide flippase family protein [Kaistella sp.]
MNGTSAPGYKGIFKSTFLFSFVQVINILVKIVLNKIVAVLLGAEGVGIIGIYNSTVVLLRTGADLGFSQSAVRDISEANNSNDLVGFSRKVIIVNRVILFTSVLGIVLTIGLSPWLSQWTLGDNSYTVAYIWLAIVVGLNILTEGQLAILKGMRQLRALAKASIIGSVVGLVSGAPMYYFFGMNGIVPSLIITALSALFFSNYFVKKVKYDKVDITITQTIKEASPMIKMGIAFMVVAFSSNLFSLIISAYLRSNAGLETVGYYQAGLTIIGSYFGIVIASMMTDYYPRISAVNSDNVKLKQEVNTQSEVGLTLLAPILVFFIFLSPYLIKLLYSGDFIKSILYTDYAIFGSIIIVCSNSLDMILLAKQKAGLFITTSIVQRVIVIFIYILLFNKYGLVGLGISYFIMSLIHLLFMSVIMGKLYNITLNIRVIMHLIIVLGWGILSLVIRNMDNTIFIFILKIMISIGALSYSYIYLQKIMGINLGNIVSKFIKK